ncbi:MAG: HDIG domain-containing protein [Verrucomicrobia bacterium]|nr:HDIG domain-containing protein [Verrucomicrobiota bacterium]
MASLQTMGPKEGYTSWRLRFLRPDKWGKRIVVGFLFSVILAFFLHYTDVFVENLELNSKAEKYVLAQVGFDFPDKEATQTLRQESSRDVGKIFRLGEEQVLKRAAEVENSLVTDDQWRTEMPLATFEKMYMAKESIAQSLLRARFVDMRTQQKMQEIGYSTEGCHIYVPPSEHLTILPQQTWYDIVTLQGPEVDYVLQLYRKAGAWEIKEELGLANAIREAVKDSIPLKKTHVDPGDHIIDPGEKVTPRHLEMMKAMKKVMAKNIAQITPTTVAGSFFMAMIFTLMSVIYFKVQHPSILRSFRKLTLLATIVILTLAVAKLSEYFLINKSGHFAEMCRYPIFVVFGTLLISLLMGKEIALVCSFFLSVVLCLTLAIDDDAFLVINVIAALMAILSSKKIRRRKQIFELCARIWLTLIPVIIAFNLYEDSFDGLHLLTDLATTFVFLTGTGLLVVGLLPILESTFDIVNDMTLMEFADPNHPLLRRLSLDAPGTYQHSLVVGVIAEAAAQAIGANGLFCRVAALYHDVGKLVNPHYFIENQGEVNIHNILTPLESAQVIMAHVTDGVALAQQHKLPQSFIDIIREHHGTSLILCFFHAQIQIGDTLIEEGAFRYRGPKPHSKESAILMVADTVEAAFRSMEQPDEQTTIELVEQLVTDKVRDGQLDDCQLTFEEIKKIKQSMVKMLLVTRHTRVKYPVRRDVFVSRIEELFVQRI